MGKSAKMCKRVVRSIIYVYSSQELTLFLEEDRFLSLAGSRTEAQRPFPLCRYTAI